MSYRVCGLVERPGDSGPKQPPSPAGTGPKSGGKDRKPGGKPR